MYRRMLSMIVAVMVIGYSCSKVKEIPTEVKPPLPYEQGDTKSLSQLLGSLPDISIYLAAYNKSNAKLYIDSVRAVKGKPDAPFTLFVPKDAAWQAAGYTLSMVQAMTPEGCDTIVKYLIAEGRILPTDYSPSGGNSIFPIIAPARIPMMMDWGGIVTFDHFYSFNIAWEESDVYLNGQKLSAVQNTFPSTDGAVYVMDYLPLKPVKTVFEILSEDPEYSFFLSALQISNQVYEEYGVGISPLNRTEELFGAIPAPFKNYYSTLTFFDPNSRGGAARFMSSYIVFAPVNDAFRKAGFNDVEAIERYIRQSYVTTPEYRDRDHAIPLYTNMDSILNYCFYAPSRGANSDIAFNFTQSMANVNNKLLYVNDLKWNATLQKEGAVMTSSLDFYDWTTFDENTWEFAKNLTNGRFQLLFPVNGDVVKLRRGDAPNGRAAAIVPEFSNITALNGVVHRIDNLLLPTP